LKRSKIAKFQTKFAFLKSNLRVLRNLHEGLQNIDFVIYTKIKCTVQNEQAGVGVAARAPGTSRGREKSTSSISLLECLHAEMHFGAKAVKELSLVVGRHTLSPRRPNRARVPFFSLCFFAWGDRERAFCQPRFRIIRLVCASSPLRALIFHVC
jgi:hypothetical protein